MKKYLVTGGSGFIGSHLAERLLRDGHAVRILDDLSTGTSVNTKSFTGKAVEVVAGDIRREETIRSSVRGVSGVFHQAALASVPRSIREPVLTNDVNLVGTMQVLEAARAENVRVVMASSSSVYGDSEILPKVETMPISPLSPYALQKAAAELYTRMYFSLYGLETVALRYFNVFGPRQDPNSEYAAVVPKFVTLMLAGKNPTILGDGEQSRDFTYVENAVAANIAAMNAPRSACGKAYNIGCGAKYSLNQLVEQINAVLGTRISAVKKERRDGDVRHSLADINAAKENLLYRPEISFEEGLRRTVAWFKSQA